MADSFADLWQTSAPVAKPQTLSSLNSNSNSNSANTPAQAQRKTPDVFALLAASSKSTSTSSSPAPTYRPSGSAQSMSRTTTASPASLSSTPSYLSPHSQPASRPSSTQPPVLNTATRSADAFGDLFSSAGGATSSSTANMTLAARARMEQAQKQKQKQQQKISTPVHSGGMDAWAGLGALGGGSKPPLAASRSRSNAAQSATGSGTGTARVDDVDDWGLGDFGSGSTSGLISKTQRTTADTVPTLSGAIIDGMEDDWGLGDFGSSSASKTAPVQAPQDEDDILGMLSKPVEHVRAAQASSISPSPSPPGPQRRTPSSSSTTTASTASTVRDPPPHILGQIVEMGFSVPQARSALLRASSSSDAASQQEWDVQGALEMLLAQQAADGSPGTRTPPLRHISSSQPAAAADRAADSNDRTDRAPPKGRRERDAERAERQERLARLEREIVASASSHGSSSSARVSSRPDAAYTDPYYPSASTSSSSAPAATAAELAQHAERVLSMGKEVGRGVLGKASAFWREGRERVERVLEERGGSVGVAVGRVAGAGRGRGGASGGAPRWMQERSGEGDDAYGHEHGYAHEQEHVRRGMGGYADGDEEEGDHTRGGGWDDESDNEKRNQPPQKQNNLGRRAVEAEVNLFSVDDDGARETTPQTKGAEEEVDLFSMPVPTRSTAHNTTAPWARPSASTSSTPKLMSSSSPSPAAPTHSRTLTPASATAIAQASTHRAAGTAAFKLGQYADAAAAYSRALDALPQGHLLRVPLLTNRALALLRTGECKGAERDCKEALGVVAGVSGDGAGDGFDATASTNAETDQVVDAWTPALESSEIIEAGRAKGNDAGWVDADAKGVGVDLVDGYVKARRRRAEAQEMQEKWRLAVRDWDALAGAPWAGEKVRGEARGAAGRCRRMISGDGATADGGGGGTSVGGESVYRAPARASSSAPKPKPKPRAPAESTPPTTTTPSGAALKALQTSTAQAEAEDTLRHTLKDGVDARIAAWRGGKETNIRALLASLDTVLWPEILAGGVQVSGLGALITPAQVKKGYVKAIARVHPDKLNPSNSTVEQRMLANGVFGTLNEAWIAFQAGAK